MLILHMEGSGEDFDLGNIDKNKASFLLILMVIEKILTIL